MGQMSKTLRETIKAITKTHLIEKNGLAMGQCLTAVGWVGGTLPELYEDKRNGGVVNGRCCRRRVCGRSSAIWKKTNVYYSISGL